MANLIRYAMFAFYSCTFFTKMDEGGEKGEEEERRYSCDSCDSFEKLKYRHDGMVIKS